MIIINDKPGQLGNQLWSYVSFITFCLKKSNTFLVPYFQDYYHLFENLNRYPNIRFGIINNSIDKYIRKVVLVSIRKCPHLLLKYLNVYVDKKNWLNECWDEPVLSDNKNILFLSSWNHSKNNEYLEEFHESIRLLFRPKKEHVKKAEEIINNKRKYFDVLIGVHIRRGDYKQFARGVYYFDDAVYTGYMQQLEKELSKEGKRVSFLLCSNEVLNLKNYNSLDVFRIADANAIEDLYALGLCDFIFGVPSTFSMWASFYGKVPLRFIKYPDESIHLKEFHAIIAPNTFASGERLVHVTV